MHLQMGSVSALIWRNDFGLVENSETVSCGSSRSGTVSIVIARPSGRGNPPETLGDCFASLAMTVSRRLYYKRVPTNYILPIILRDAKFGSPK